MTGPLLFPDLPTLAGHLRAQLRQKNYILLFAYNGTGKTRLSGAFKDLGKDLGKDPGKDGDRGADGAARDTLYFNAYTEDLFTWDNDLDGDRARVLRLNSTSRFFAGFVGLELETRIRALVDRYADFAFRIDTDAWVVHFSRTVDDVTHDAIKISRGEENMFIWCFFLVLVELVLDRAEAYEWVDYLYIDDPISSLDEQNAIAVANHLAQMLKRADNPVKTVISTHHPLFFNVLSNELSKAQKYVLSKQQPGPGYRLDAERGDVPFFYHVAGLVELYRAMEEDRLLTYHFTQLRVIMEKTANFHGYRSFADCIDPDDQNDPDRVLYARMLNILSHGAYSLFEPRPMLAENKGHFRKILTDFLDRFSFNRAMFQDAHHDTPPDAGSS